MFSSFLFLQKNVLVRTDIQMTTEHQRVPSALRQQMDFTSRTLLLMEWRDTFISPNRRETKDSLIENLDTDYEIKISQSASLPSSQDPLSTSPSPGQQGPNLRYYMHDSGGVQIPNPITSQVWLKQPLQWE